MEKIETERRAYRFYGMVQGVGFRYRAKYAAELYGLTGWVENLDDGSVAMEAQGPAAQLNRLVEAITRNARWIQIENMEMQRVPLRERERGFTTRGW